MTVNLSLLGGAAAQFFDNSGNVLTGGKLYTYAAGTTTPQATYTTAYGNTAWSNPIVLDAAGRVSGSGEIWLATGFSYKFVLKDTNDVLIATYDNIPGTSTNVPILNDASSIAYEPGYSVTAGNFVVGDTYLITSIGTTDFTTIGALTNTVGLHFIATGVGSGTGTAEYSTTVQSKLRESLSVLDFGAVGDGTTDDTVAIQAALDYASTVQKLIEIPGGYSCRFTDNLTIPTDTGFCGIGELYADYTNSFGEVVVSTTGGSAGTQTLLTADALVSSATITVASVTGISADSYILIGSNKYNGRYPQQIFRVVSVNSGTKVITLSSPCGCEYLVSESAYVKPLTMISNVTVQDVTFRCSSAANFGEFFAASYVVNLLVDNVKVLNHKSQEGVGGGITNSAAGGISANYCFNATLQNNILYGSDTYSPGAAAVSAAYTQKALIQGNKSNNYAFGFGLYYLYQGIMNNNNGVGIALNGNRGLKTSACVSCIIDSNIISNFDTGIKIEDASYCTYTNNVLTNLSVGGIAINLSTNQALVSSLYNTFDSNSVYNAIIGVLTDVYCSGTTISNNVFKTLSGRGMILETDCVVSGNQVSGFVTYGIGFPQNSTIANNIIYTQANTTPCLQPLGAFQRSNVTNIIGNQAYNNPLASGYDAEFAYCSFSGNNIKGQPVTVSGTAIPTTGTWVVGDTVLNTSGIPFAWVCAAAGSPGTWRAVGSTQTAVLATQLDKTDTSLNYISGLGGSVVSGNKYTFRVGLFIDADSTGGYKVAIGGSSTTVSSVTYQVNGWRTDTAAMVLCSRGTAWSTGTGGYGNAGGTTIYIEITGSFVATGNGNFQPLFAQNAASGTSSVLINSFTELSIGS